LPKPWILVRHKLKDYGMMRSFMTSRSITWGMELDKGLKRSNTTPFPEESAAMMVYGDASHREGTVRLAQAAGHQLIMGGDVGDEGCDNVSFFVS
jgi:hypothetical protein